MLESPLFFLAVEEFHQHYSLDLHHFFNPEHYQIVHSTWHGFLVVKHPACFEVHCLISSLEHIIWMKIDYIYGTWYVVYKNRKKVVYLEVLWEIYGILAAILLRYRKLCKDLDAIGFKFNNYYPCVVNVKKLTNKLFMIAWMKSWCHIKIPKLIWMLLYGRKRSTAV